MNNKQPKIGINKKALTLQLNFAKQNIYKDNLKQQYKCIQNLYLFDQNDNFSINFYYKELEILGQGSSGLVKKCRRISDGQIVSIKSVRISSEEIIELSIKQFIHINKLQHHNIIQTFELFIDLHKELQWYVMEYFESNTLLEKIVTSCIQSEEIARQIFKQIILGIQFLHKNGICHRDINPNNILYQEKNNQIKIIDFNISKINLSTHDLKSSSFKFQSQNIEMNTYTGTIAYQAPEQFSKFIYYESIDVWAAGAVLYTLLTGNQPFQEEIIGDLVEAIKNQELKFPDIPFKILSKQVKDLLQRCLIKTPEKRISCQEILIHPWIVGFEAQKKLFPHQILQQLQNNYQKIFQNNFNNNFNQLQKFSSHHEILNTYYKDLSYNQPLQQIQNIQENKQKEDLDDDEHCDIHLNFSLPNFDQKANFTKIKKINSLQKVHQMNSSNNYFFKQKDIKQGQILKFNENSIQNTQKIISSQEKQNEIYISPLKKDQGSIQYEALYSLKNFQSLMMQQADDFFQIDEIVEQIQQKNEQNQKQKSISDSIDYDSQINQ